MSAERPRKIDAELQQLACCDSSCCIRKPRGMSTNGGCRCLMVGDLLPVERSRIRRALNLRQEQVKLLTAMLEAQ